MKIIVHRAGYTYIDNEGKEIPGENTIKNASLSLNQKKIDGIEIDLQYTKDLEPVVIHRSVANLTLKEFDKKYPNNNTLKEWVQWYAENIKNPETIIYFDIKRNRKINNEVVVRELFEILLQFNKQIFIGSTDKKFVKILSNIKKEIQVPFKIFYMVPETFLPARSIEKIAKEFVRDGKADIDGVHFFFIDSIWKELVSILFRRGDFVTLTDYFKKRRVLDKRRIPIPNLYLFQDLYYLKTKIFVSKAQRKGFLVIGASTGSVNSLEKMRDMGCDFLMVNVPEDAEFL